jgi:hypothetical protein
MSLGLKTLSAILRHNYPAPFWCKRTSNGTQFTAGPAYLATSQLLHGRRRLSVPSIQPSCPDKLLQTNSGKQHRHMHAPVLCSCPGQGAAVTAALPQASAPLSRQRRINKRGRCLLVQERSQLPQLGVRLHFSRGRRERHRGGGLCLRAEAQAGERLPGLAMERSGRLW